MRTLQLSLTGAFILASLGGAVVGATEDAPAGPSLVTGTEQCYDGAELVTSYEPGYRLSHRAWFRCFVQSSDPRLTGLSTGESWRACYPGGCVYWGTYEIKGPDGSWVGPWKGTDDANLRALVAQVVLEGTDAYEGWTYVHDSIAPFGSADSETSGMVYEGPPPPWEPPAE